ncbi:MAG TPA: lysylphosphatidylglycerol synthase transmembrane domain-containing protein [Myxococcaceae bacterium]|nr:lysylphosphatidylglycerol synthase transmembrane domain-containing protein [Myxococcaceae bacterium]
MKIRARTGFRFLLAVLGATVSLGLLSTAFFRWNLSGDGPTLTPRFEVGTFLRQIPENLPWLLPFAVLSAAVIPLRALQWQRALATPVTFRERYHLVAIGAFVHNLIPGKLGELTRAFLLSRTQSLPLVRSLGSVAVCKLLEFAALMLVLSAAVLLSDSEAIRPFLGKLKIAAVVCLVLTSLVVALARFSGRLSQLLVRSERTAGLGRSLAHLGEGLGTARSVRGMGRLLLMSLPPVVAPALAYGIGLEAIGIQGGIWAGPVVLGAIAVGQAPGLPAGMGIFYFLVSWVARSLGAAEEAAAAYAALTHLTSVVTLIAVGAVSVWMRKLRWRDLRRGSALAQKALQRVDAPVASVLKI